MKKIYECNYCGHQSGKWLGRCPECGKWNTFTEGLIGNSSSKSKTNNYLDQLSKTNSLEVFKLDEIDDQNIERHLTTISQFDITIGGGIVPSSFILLGGDPGIGKSTLILQIADKIASGKKVLYISAEEDVSQIKLRGQRLKINIDSNLYLASVNKLEDILTVVKKITPDFLIIDSIQTIYSQELSQMSGSIAQVKFCTNILLQLTKQSKITTFLIGQVTKDGEIAGPKLLEHLVDTVLYLEGEKYTDFRLLKVVKNRYGAAGEVGIFSMTEHGLLSLDNASELFLSNKEKSPGSSLSCIIEGTKPILLEVQALTNWTKFGYPQRTIQGYNMNRLQILLAVMIKYLQLKLENMDVYVNIVGGLKTNEPSLDLSVCVSIISSIKNIKIDKKSLFLGEVGLNWEIRAVSFLEKRLKEAQKIGIAMVYMPQQKVPKTISSKMKIIKLDNLKEIIKILG